MASPDSSIKCANACGRCTTGKRHPASMGGPEVERFLTHQAVERQVSASTQSQALSALLFLYRRVLGVELPCLDGVVRPKPSLRLRVKDVGFAYMQAPVRDGKGASNTVCSPLDQ